MWESDGAAPWGKYRAKDGTVHDTAQQAMRRNGEVDKKGQAAMSTDALREALQNIIAAYDEWANNTDSDFGSRRVDVAIENAKAALLAAPASETLEKKYAAGLQWAAANPEDAKEMLEAIRPSETEKLPVKWRRWADALMHTESRDYHVTAAAHQVCADELEAALKTDRCVR